MNSRLYISQMTLFKPAVFLDSRTVGTICRPYRIGVILRCAIPVASHSYDMNYSVALLLRNHKTKTTTCFYYLLNMILSTILLVHFGYRLTANRELMCLYTYKCERNRYIHTHLTQISVLPNNNASTSTHAVYLLLPFIFLFGF
jgi:hypothetical protein